MTSTDHRPPLRAVNPPQHDDSLAWQLDRRRFAAFLTAKDLLLGYTRTATEGAGRLTARLHLDGLLTMVRRSYGCCSALPQWLRAVCGHQGSSPAWSGA